MKATDAVAKFLAAHQVRYCFELVGGMITHLLDGLAEHGQFNIVSMHHEQAAGFAAEGVARQSAGKKIAVAMGTSGPGATNLITAIGSCWFDSVPCLFITGQVNTNELKGDLAIRQQGFQELDIVPMVSSITKYAVQITEIEQLLPSLHHALSVCQSGRKGPVLLDIPNDIQRRDIPDEVVEAWLSKPLAMDTSDHNVLSDEDLAALKRLCAEAKRPLICFGGGAKWEKSATSWIEGLQEFNIPYVATLMGQERIAASSSCFGMIGSYGSREANWAIQNCDLLIVLGARLDVRQTGSDTNDFARHAKVIQIDIDPAQLDNRVKVALKLCTNMDGFFAQFEIDNETFPNIAPRWMVELAEKKRSCAIDEYPDWKIGPTKFFQLLNQVMHNQAVDYVCDVGNHQMWAALGIRLEKNQAIHHSGGMGAMGFSLPVAIGMALSSSRKAIVITGDGGFQINSQELDTVHRLGLDIAIIVMNNFSLGMVKNFQDMYFDGRNQSTKKGYSCPAFVNLAGAYGLEAIAVDDLNQLEAAFGRMVQTEAPLLIEVMMDGATECRPRLTFGGQLDDQYPKVD